MTELPPIDRVLGALSGIRKTRAGHWMARCPSHDDRKASLSVTEAPDGKVLVKCFTGCTSSDVVAAAGLQMRDLFPARTDVAPSARREPQKAKTAAVVGPRAASTLESGRPRPAQRSVTLAELAAAKQLPVEFLRSLGVSDGRRGVEIPYADAGGELLGTKRRTALAAKDGSWWERDKPLAVYGLWKLEEMRSWGDDDEPKILVLVEGETDAWALWYHRIPALGLPGASSARSLSKDHLTDFREVVVSVEPDRGGETFARSVPERLAEIGFPGLVSLIRMPDGIKDPQALHAARGAEFDVAWRAVVSGREDARREPEPSVVQEPAGEPSRTAPSAVTPIVAIASLTATARRAPDDDEEPAVPVRRFGWKTSVVERAKPKVAERVAAIGVRVRETGREAIARGRELVRDRVREFLDIHEPTVAVPAPAPERPDEHRFPELRGTPKAIGWGKAVRAELLRSIDEEFKASFDQATPEERAKLLKVRGAVRDWLSGQKNASWWIDNRGCDARTMLAIVSSEEPEIARNLLALPSNVGSRNKEVALEGTPKQQVAAKAIRERVRNELGRYFGDARAGANERERPRIAELEAAVARYVERQSTAGAFLGWKTARAADVIRQARERDPEVRDALTSFREVGRAGERGLATSTRDEQIAGVRRWYEASYRSASRDHQADIALEARSVLERLRSNEDARFWASHLGDDPVHLIAAALERDRQSHSVREPEHRVPQQSLSPEPAPAISL